MKTSVYKSALAALATVLVSCHVFIGMDDTALAPDAGTPDADIPDASGSPDVAVLLVAHVPIESSAPGTVDLVLDDATINTTRRTIETESTLPAVTFDVANQIPWDETIPPLAILHVRGLTIRRGTTVEVIGEFPLVIIAGGPVVIEGILDASADGRTPGAGGALPGEGLGAGLGGEHAGKLDSGGGGAGHGLPGKRGGDALCDGVDCTVAVGGGGGVAHGEETLPVLRGGSGGGGNSCAVYGDRPSAGGGGGGAVQIYSQESIVFAETGGIHAGGGGGGRGTIGDLICDPPIFTIRHQSGSGGGAGGAIFLQAPRITNHGILAANGGGGGGSAGDGTGGGDGNGQDAVLDATPASGGTAGGGTRGAAGGAGGALYAPAEPGGDAPASADNDGNGGGGGGAVGRIVIVSDAGGFDDSGVISPAPHTVP